MLPSKNKNLTSITVNIYMDNIIKYQQLQPILVKKTAEVRMWSRKSDETEIWEIICADYVRTAVFLRKNYAPNYSAVAVILAEPHTPNMNPVN